MDSCREIKAPILFAVFAFSSLILLFSSHVLGEEKHPFNSSPKDPDQKPIPSQLRDIESFDSLISPSKSPSSYIFRLSPSLREKTLFSEVKLTALGNTGNVTDFLLLLHGDIPRYYQKPFGRKRDTPSIDTDFFKLHHAMTSCGRGMVVAQPLCSSKDWHALFKDDKSDPRAEQLATHLVAVFWACSRVLGNEKLRLHLHSFSGAGRVDRALHQHFTAAPGDGKVQFLVNENLKSWAASDAMVNNAFSSEDKLELQSVMARSWAEFLFRFPHIYTTFIYDRSATYPYMQGIHLDVFRFHADLQSSGKISSDASVKIIRSANGVFTANKDSSLIREDLGKLERKTQNPSLQSGEDHLSTFLGRISAVFLNRIESTVPQ